ncbi:MAG: DUF262 domain-containing protein [Bacteroidota bacterium]
MPNKIDSDKIFINKAFEWWYRVPDYQRPYVWGTDQVTDLLDDVTQWMYSRPDSEYFLGSMVLQERHNNGIVEYDLLDGQQRLSTCLMVYAVGRDLAKDVRLEELCREVVFQQDDPFRNIPERLRIVYDVRDNVRDFVNEFIKPKDGTNDEAGLRADLKANDLSVRNMANAVLQIRSFFQQTNAPSVEDFFKFFGNKVLLVYVSSPNLDDAFRMFTVLNDRGMKLRGSDILKTSNLRALREDKASDEEIRRWAKYWEQLEGELLDDFDIFLSHIRSVLVKDKARLSLLQEFEDNIYAPRSFDRQTKLYQARSPLLKRGKDTFQCVERYYKHYQQLLSGNNYTLNDSYQLDNFITLLNETSLADFWFPPLLRYREVFGDYRIPEFMRKLEDKFCGDWITSETPTDRISAMNRITAAIDKVNKMSLSSDQKTTQLLASPEFEFNRTRFRYILENEGIYGRRFARYLLFKIDVLLAGRSTQLKLPSQMSVEHILPQTPESGSQWCKDFTENDRKVWTDRIGNLVLISRRKNSSQGRLDFKQKKAKYFKNNVEIFPNSVRAMTAEKWDLQTLQEYHIEIIKKLCI